MPKKSFPLISLPSTVVSEADYDEITIDFGVSPAFFAGPNNNLMGLLRAIHRNGIEHGKDKLKKDLKALLL